MKSNTKTNGTWLYKINKNGKNAAKPTWYQYYGSEKTPEDVIARLEKLNVGSKWIKA